MEKKKKNVFEISDNFYWACVQADVEGGRVKKKTKKKNIEFVFCWVNQHLRRRPLSTLLLNIKKRR